MMQATAAAAAIVDFALAFSAADLQHRHFRQVSRAIIDTIAVAVAGRHEKASRIALDHARCHSGGSGANNCASAWGFELQLPVEAAAMVNGITGHVLDFDDVTSPLRGHPSIALLPPLLALAEAGGKTGVETATAYVVGFEVLCKMAKAMAAEHYARGWHSTSSIGTIAATVACARLLGLGREQMLSAIGLAVAQSAGTRANFGTMAKSFQAGHCGASAVRAVLLAQRGFTGAGAALDGEFGYMELYANGEDLQAQLDTLGRGALEIDASGIEVKKYPLCYATHRAIDGLLALRAEHGLALDLVERIEVVANYRALVPLIHDRPRTGLEAKFSMQYAIAAALADGCIRLISFDDEAVQRPRIQAFLPLVAAREETGPAMPRWTRIVLHLRNGRRLEKHVTQLRGGADCPLDDAELLDKVEDCFRFGCINRSAKAFVDAAYDLRGQRIADMLKYARAYD